MTGSVSSQEIFSLKKSYDSQVFIEGTDQVSIKQGMQLALSSLLVNLSGNSKIVNEKSIRAMMNVPEKYVTQYKLGTEDKKIYASFIFEGDLIRSYLSENELPLWLSNDNLILSYLPCKEESDTVKSEEENEKCNQLEEILNDLSSRRNSIIANPLMDLKDINYFESLGSISTERFMKRISRRYEVGPWLLCLIKDEFGLLLNKPKCLSSLGKQSSPSEALNDLLDKVNSKKSLVVDKNIKNKTSIRVIGITNLANLENVLNDLKSQVLVYGVTLKKVEGDTLDILLSHFGKSEDLKNLLNINDNFKGMDNSSAKVVSYKYNNS
tara:strand:+ start:3452 stop:4423 length:972 start_codon:yes stop_codon:yes gene_type:complete